LCNRFAFCFGEELVAHDFVEIGFRLREPALLNELVRSLNVFENLSARKDCAVGLVEKPA
jgi:hypothetical protein